MDLLYIPVYKCILASGSQHCTWHWDHKHLDKDPGTWILRMRDSLYNLNSRRILACNPHKGFLCNQASRNKHLHFLILYKPRSHHMVLVYKVKVFLQ